MGIEIRDERKFWSFELDNRLVTQWGALIGTTGVSICCALACHGAQNRKRPITVAAIAGYLGLSVYAVDACLELMRRLGLVARLPRRGGLAWELADEIPARPGVSEDWTDAGCLGSRPDQ